jgi:hypothetical protein
MGVPVTWSRERGAGPAVGDDELESALTAGEHALYVAGDLGASRKWFDAAYQEAAGRRDGRSMARAALGHGGLWVHEHRRAADAAMVRVRQRDALPLIDPKSALALRLRVRLAAEEDFPARADGTILNMVAAARRSGDPVTLAEALSLAHHCLLGPEHAHVRLELARELIGEASKTNRRGDLLMGLLWHTVDLFLSADPHAERGLEELRGLLARENHLAVGSVVGAIEVLLAIRAGRFDQAEALAATCAERAAAAGHGAGPGWYAAQLGAIRWYQGRIAELLPMLRKLVTSPTLSRPDNAGYPGLAVAAAVAGDRRLAEGALARLRDQVLGDRPRSSSWLMSMCCVVDAAHLLADAQTAARAYALLGPVAQLPAILGVGAVCVGSVQRHLGVAALTTGAADRAVGHLRAAVQDNLALGHWPAVVLSRWHLGAALALRDGPRDEAARRELTLAAQEAAALGMTLPAEQGQGRARSGQVGPAGDAGTGDDAGSPAAALVVCRRRGRKWQVELGGRTVLVEHSVGMRHLAVLLANPGYEVPVIELAAGAGYRETSGAHGAAGSAQPVLDDLAKRGYKQRLSQLQAEIDELESMNDLERAGVLRAERDWLIDELTAATGLGGRPREFAGNEERARVAVGKAIRRAVKRIADADPVIGAELTATVLTGRRCCYRPE